jgi:uncharacterized tellurite resistance protein B-like protein
MLRQIKALIASHRRAGADDQPDSEGDAVALAASALMVEAARMDDDFGPEERAQITSLMGKHFGRDEARAQALLEEAEGLVEKSSQLYGFTRVLKNKLSYQERVDFVEMLWQVSYADGELHDYEANLMRRIAGLLFVEDRDSGDARKRALDKLAARP